MNNGRERFKIHFKYFDTENVKKLRTQEYEVRKEEKGVEGYINAGVKEFD